jgi:limonene-1,2-epoxide hydrolase
MKGELVVLYLFKTTTSVEEFCRSLEKNPLRAKDSRVTKQIILVDNPLVTTQDGHVSPLTILHRAQVQLSASQARSLTKAVSDHYYATHSLQTS